MKQAQKGCAGAPPAELPQMERQLAKLRDDLQVLHFRRSVKNVGFGYQRLLVRCNAQVLPAFMTCNMQQCCQLLSITLTLEVTLT